MKEFSPSPLLRILLVEDNEHDRQAFCRTLKKNYPACEVTQCIRAEEALEQLKNRGAQRFNLLVVDYNLPGMSGLELCGKLLRENTGLPMVLLTGMGSEQLAVDAIKMGVSDYIAKDPDSSYLNLLPVILPDVIRKHADRMARLHAEDALRKSEEKFRMMVENAYDAILVLQDDILKFPNPRAEQMLGYSREELENLPFSQLFHPHHRSQVLEKHNKELEKNNFSSLYALRLVNKQGEELWADLNAIRIHWEGKPAILYFLRDITEKKQLEAQLLQVQKMQALGVMAGGIAHDFNNLLMCIQSNVSLIFTNTNGGRSGNPHCKELENIEQCVQSGANLTRQLLGFARAGKYEVVPTDLNMIIDETLTMYQCIGKSVSLHKAYAKKLKSVEVDQGQLHQVLLNIFLNACQAMPEGGSIHIQTNNITIHPDNPNNIELTPGDYVMVSVKDTGVGMDEATRQRIFEPFFTTRGPGEGAGLGLASAYGIIKNHGGIIDVSSKEHKGTTFSIYLPASAKKAREKENIPIESAPTPPPGTVLFVDDEEMITSVGQKVLEQMGYNVLTASSGNQAVQIYKNNKDRVNLVILDLIMPGISASETYDALKKMNPNIKVLLSSGYGMDAQIEHLLQKGCKGFIQKPFYMKQLCRKIETIMQDG